MPTQAGLQGRQEGNYGFRGKSRPKSRTLTLKKLAFEPSSDSAAPSFSVYLDYTGLAEDISDSSENGNDVSQPPQASPLEPVDAKRTIAIKKSYPDFASFPVPRTLNDNAPSPNMPHLARNPSTDTVNTNLLMDPRKDLVHASGANVAGDHTREEQDNDYEVSIPLRPFKHNPPPGDRNSKRTISTSMLDSSSILVNSNSGKQDTKRFSYTSDGERSPILTEPHRNQLHNKIAEESEGDTSEYENHSKPSIEQAVKLFKQEASTQPSAKLVEQVFPAPNSRSVAPKKSQGSLKSHLSSQNSRYSQTRRSRRGPKNPSLLTSILIPPGSTQSKVRSSHMKKAAVPAIPALRQVSGNSNSSKASGQSDNSNNEKKEKNATEQLSKPPKMPFRDARDTLYPIYQYRDQLEEKDIENEAFYSQYVDASSASSEGSKVSRFVDVFSVWRIILFILICITMPPLFFAVGLNPRHCVTDERLMKLILNRQHRYGLFSGFVWDIKLDWFRRTCLLLGTIEVLAILACIGVGFGVGLSRE